MGEFIKSEKELTELSRLISQKKEELTWFDLAIFFDVRKFIAAVMNSDILGHYVNHEEANLLYCSLEDYLLHKESVLQDKSYVKKHYNVDIKAIHETTKWQSIIAHPVTEMQFIDCIPKIKKLLSLYPPVFIKNIKLDSIIIASSFSQYTKSHQCIYLGGFETNEDHNIYLTANQCHKSFHHELYHQAMQHYDDVREWANLRNEKDHFYNHQALAHKTLGFAVNYGRENVAEDQATVAEYMIRDHASMVQLNMTTFCVKRCNWFIKLCLP